MLEAQGVAKLPKAAGTEQGPANRLEYTNEHVIQYNQTKAF